MNSSNKSYLYTAALCFWKPQLFFESAISTKRSYVILHFLLVFCLLYIPIFSVAVRSQPDELYARMFSQDFDDAVFLNYGQETFSPEKINQDQPVIYFFADFTIYADSNIVLSAPSEFFTELFPHETLQGSYDRTRPAFGEVFSMIAMYNMYITSFLLPLLAIAFFVLLVLQLFFYIMSVLFLGIFRLASSKIDFGNRVKIVILSSLFPALISMAAGFFLPAVHIILFQMLNLLLMYILSKKVD